MKKKILNWIFRTYKDDVYDFVVKEFIGEIPDVVSEPVLDFLADRRVLFEKFLSIQAYNIQRARIMSKKGADFYDGALVIIRAFLAAVNKKTQERTTVIPEQDKTVETKEQLDGISDFMKMGRKLNE